MATLPCSDRQIRCRFADSIGVVQAQEGHSGFGLHVSLIVTVDLRQIPSEHCASTCQWDRTHPDLHSAVAVVDEKICESVKIATSASETAQLEGGRSAMHLSRRFDFGIGAHCYLNLGSYCKKVSPVL